MQNLKFSNCDILGLERVSEALQRVTCQKLPIFPCTTTLLKNFQNLSSPGQIFREKRIFRGLPVWRNSDRPYFWHPLMMGKKLYFIHFLIFGPKKYPPLLSYCVLLTCFWFMSCLKCLEKNYIHVAVL